VQVDERRSSATLHGFLTGLLPQLKAVRITHGWKGNVAFSFDQLPHIGARRGAPRARCNGSGVC
jgi:glycine/D-amino acid oxidase-like deaminating enzyme